MTQRQPARAYAPGTNWLFRPSPVKDNALAFGHGATDVFTFGLADRGSSAIKAAGDALRRRDLSGALTSYRRHMAEEEAQDRFEDHRYGTARALGKLAGTAAQFATMAPEAMVANAGRRIAQAAPLAGSELAALAVGGGAANVGGQALTDRVTGHRSSLADYAGSAVGGAMGGLAGTYGLGGLAGAVGGAATSVSQDIANGRLDRDVMGRAIASAGDGAALGALGGVAGRKWSNGLSNNAKEQLGETIARVRTAVRGDKTLPPSPRTKSGKTGHRLTDGRITFPDQRTKRGALVEAKFGNKAELSDNQTQAYEEARKRYPGELKPRPEFFVYHARPKDIGAGAGAVLSGLSRPRSQQ